MIDFLLILLLCLAGIAVAAHVLRGLFRRKNALGIDGKLIWIDKGRQTKPFFHHTYEVLGKPDLMYQVDDGVLAVEYKSRRGRIYDSDIVQAKCASLAARGSGYKVRTILVKTATQQRYFSLPPSDKELFEELKPYILLARQSRSGTGMQAKPNRPKCSGCAYKYKCDHAAS